MTAEEHDRELDRQIEPLRQRINEIVRRHKRECNEESEPFVKAIARLEQQRRILIIKQITNANPGARAAVENQQ